MSPERRYVVAILETVSEFFAESDCPLTPEQRALVQAAQLDVISA